MLKLRKESLILQKYTIPKDNVNIDKVVISDQFS